VFGFAVDFIEKNLRNTHAERETRQLTFETLVTFFKFRLRLVALRLRLRLHKILKHQLRLLYPAENLQVTRIRTVVSILPRKAKYTPRLFCCWLNTNGSSCHMTSTIQRDTTCWSLDMA